MSVEQIGLLAAGGVLGAYLLLLADIACAVIRDRQTQEES
jgi:hypothetical protein